MRLVLCRGCRASLTASARAALDILSDPRSSEVERATAADVASHALDHLMLPAPTVTRAPEAS